MARRKQRRKVTEAERKARLAMLAGDLDETDPAGVAPPDDGASDVEPAPEGADAGDAPGACVGAHDGQEAGAEAALEGAEDADRNEDADSETAGAAAPKGRQGQQEVTMAKQRLSTVNGIDEEVLGKLREDYEWVRVQVLRKGAGGRWVYMRGLSAIMTRPHAVADLPDVLERFGGGGTYVLRVYDPEDRLKRLANFQVSIAGPPRKEPANHTIYYDEDAGKFTIGPTDPAAEYFDEAEVGGVPSGFGRAGRFAVDDGPVGGFGFGRSRPPSAFGFGSPRPEGPNGFLGAELPPLEPKRDPSTGRLLPPPDELVPPRFRTLPLEQQWRVAQQTYQQQAATMASDQVTMYFNQRLEHELRELQSRNAALQERLEALMREREKEAERLREERARIEREAERQRHEAQLAELRAEIKALGEGRKSGGLDDETKKLLLTLASSLGPTLVQAFTQSSAKSREQFVELLKATMEGKKGESEKLAALLSTVLPAITPVVTKLLEMKSPETHAQVQLATTEAAMASLKLAFDLMQAEKENQGEVKWWMPIVDHLLNTLDTAATAKLLQAQGQQAAGALPAAGAEAGGQQPQPTPEGGAAQAQSAAQSAQQAQAQANLEQHAQRKLVLSQVPKGLLDYMHSTNPEIAKAVFQLWAGLPPQTGFATPEWLRIFFDLAAAVAPEQEAAERLVDFVLHLEEFGTLPELLVEVVDNPEQLQVFAVFVAEKVPGSNPEYLQRVFALATELLAQARSEEQAAQAPANGAAKVTPIEQAKGGPKKGKQPEQPSKS